MGLGVGEEYEPLFARGFYDVSFADIGRCLRPLLVDSFPAPEHRKKMWGKLCRLFEVINSVSFITEVWLDGSFVCKKAEPNDVDMVVIFGNPDRCRYSQQEKLTFLRLHNKAEMLPQYSCDMFFVSEEDSKEQEYWKNEFGYIRPVGTEQTKIPKGIVRIFLR